MYKYLNNLKFAEGSEKLANLVEKGAAAVETGGLSAGVDLAREELGALKSIAGKAKEGVSSVVGQNENFAGAEGTLYDQVVEAATGNENAVADLLQTEEIEEGFRNLSSKLKGKESTRISGKVEGGGNKAA